MLNNPGSGFWEYIENLVALNQVVIDRPRGSVNPRWPDLIYPVDYGYLKGTRSSDGSEIDIWAGSHATNGNQGVLISVDLFKRDAEFSILLGCTEADQEKILQFSNSGFKRAYLLPRYPNEIQLFQNRRSVRRFRTDPIPADVLESILEAATLAPSAHNSQPWRFAVLVAQEAKEKLAQAMGVEFRRDLINDGIALKDAQRQVERSRQRIQQAPVVILLCLDCDVVDPYPDPIRQRASYLMMTQSVAIAGGYLLLAAQAHGLGGVWMCAPLFVQDMVRKALDLPGEWEPQGLALIGYPAKIPEPRPRRSVDEVARFYK